MIVYSGIEVWNAPISGTTAEYTAPSLAPLLAGASKLLVQVRTAQGAGSSPTLTVDLERSNDGLNYASVAANALITNLAVSTSGVTNAFAQWDTTASDNLFGCFLRLKISLGGTTPSANVRITLTGRAKRRRSRSTAPEGNSVPGKAACGCTNCTSQAGSGGCDQHLSSLGHITPTRATAPATVSRAGTESLDPQPGLSLAAPTGRVGSLEFGCREVEIRRPTPGWRPRATGTFCDECPEDAACYRAVSVTGSPLGMVCIQDGTLVNCSFGCDGCVERGCCGGVCPDPTEHDPPRCCSLAEATKIENRCVRPCRFNLLHPANPRFITTRRVICIGRAGGGDVGPFGGFPPFPGQPMPLPRS